MAFDFLDRWRFGAGSGLPVFLLLFLSHDGRGRRDGVVAGHLAKVFAVLIWHLTDLFAGRTLADVLLEVIDNQQICQNGVVVTSVFLIDVE